MVPFTKTRNKQKGPDLLGRNILIRGIVRFGGAIDYPRGLCENWSGSKRSGLSRDVSLRGIYI